MHARVLKRQLLEFAATQAVAVATERITQTITPDDQARLVDRYAAQLKEIELVTRHAAATRYARALFDVALRESDVSTVGDELNRFVGADSIARSARQRLREPGDSCGAQSRARAGRCSSASVRSRRRSRS